MDLYQGCTVPVPEFVSLSILLKPSAPGAAKNSITDPFVLLSPTSTISSEETISVIKDLHRHVSSILAASYAADSSSSISATIIAQDSSLQSGEDTVARFRPTKANGIAVDYKLIRDPNRVSALTPIILSHTARGQKPGTLSNVFCIIISRALTGCSYAHASSFRVADQIESCVGSLVSPGNNSTDTASAILSRLLLSEDNERITNQMEASRRSLPRLSTANFMSPASKKSSRRNSAAENTGPTNGINGDETRSEPVLFQELSSDQSRRKVEELNILSLVETDTSMRCYEKTGQERKANLDLTGGKSRFRRRKDNQKDPDLDGFDYKGPRKQDRTRNAQSASHASENVLLSTKRHQFATVGPSTGDAASSMLQSIQSPPVSQSRRNVKDLGTLSRRNVAARRGKHVFDEETVTSNPVSVENHPKVQINIALNEDLSCSYRLSEISSCTVEGVVQVQVKSNSSSPTPFGMTIHDSSNHIDVLQENKKFATIQPSRKQGGSESRFVITVPPKADNYFPVLKYKCISDLRPVPIVSAPTDVLRTFYVY